MEIEKLLRFLVEKGGSDLHLKVNRPPLLRLKGDLIPTDLPVLSRDDIHNLLFPLLTEIQREKLAADRKPGEELLPLIFMLVGDPFEELRMMTPIPQLVIEDPLHFSPGSDPSEWGLEPAFYGEEYLYPKSTAPESAPPEKQNKREVPNSKFKKSK